MTVVLAVLREVGLPGPARLRVGAAATLIEQNLGGHAEVGRQLSARVAANVHTEDGVAVVVAVMT